MTGSKIGIEDPSAHRRLIFWVRRRRWTEVRLPVTAWPQIAAWVMRRTPGVNAGEQALTRGGVRRRPTDAPKRLPAN